MAMDPLTGGPSAADMLAAMNDLSATVKAHTQSIRNLSSDQSTMARVLRWLRGLVVFDVGATVVGFVLAIITVAIINGILGNLHSSVSEQCSTLELLIGTYRGAPGPGSPIDAATYREDYLRMQRSADHLSCGIRHVVPGT